MRCHLCRADTVSVIAVAQGKRGGDVKRRRSCASCGARWNTVETVVKPKRLRLSCHDCPDLPADGSKRCLRCGDLHRLKTNEAYSQSAARIRGTKAA